jgi:hypothetical protein
MGDASNVRKLLTAEEWLTSKLPGCVNALKEDGVRISGGVIVIFGTDPKNGSQTFSFVEACDDEVYAIGALEVIKGRMTLRENRIPIVSGEEDEGPTG